jgi:hypothetical protein
MKRKLSKGKSVSFDLEANEVQSYDREPCNTWLSSQELEDLKQEALEEALEIRRRHSHHVFDSSSYSNSILRLYLDAVAHRPVQLDHCARLFADDNIYRRGLEFHAVYTLRLERSKRRLKLRQAVRDLRGSDADTLARVLQALSKPAVQFAQAMGQVDELVVDNKPLAVMSSPQRTHKRPRLLPPPMQTTPISVPS